MAAEYVAPDPVAIEIADSAPEVPIEAEIIETKELPSNEIKR